MKILVTGGTGVVGRATITELLRRGWQVRLLSRGAAEDATAWENVEAHAGDITDAAGITGAAAGCSAIIHIAGIVEESPPGLTFASVNVNGTANILAEAVRADVRRLIYVSSLGAERGQSDYHASKREAEQLVRAFPQKWTIVRTAAVMGPRDETVSVLLRMMRTLPVVPVIEDGAQQFQPVWHEDLGWALAECLERTDVDHRVLRIAGPDIVTIDEVLDVFSSVTQRKPLRVPLPSFIARVGTAVVGALGFETPVSAATVQMLLEGNYVRAGESNDLTELLGYQPLPTRNRLVELADALPEQTPDQGVGKLQRRQFTVDIHGSPLTAAALLEKFRDHFTELVPFEAAAEPGAPTRLDENATMTLHLPARGNVQVRVEQLDERTITLATIEGHPLAGVVRFRCDDRDGGVLRFTIDVIERPATRIDQLSMAVVGSAAQKRSWQQTAEHVVQQSGGSAPAGVREESWELTDVEAEPVEAWVRDMVQWRQRHTENRA